MFNKRMSEICPISRGTVPDNLVSKANLTKECSDNQSCMLTSYICCKKVNFAISLGKLPEKGFSPKFLAAERIIRQARGSV